MKNTAFKLLERTYNEWLADGAPQLAAALTFYVFLSLAPMLVLGVGVLGRYLGDSAVAEQVLERAYDVAGPVGQIVVRELIATSEPSALGSIAPIIALTIALFGSMRVFSQLRIAFDRMWKIPRAELPAGLRKQLGLALTLLGRDNLASFLMVLVIGGLLVALTVLSAVLAAAADRLAPQIDVAPLVFRGIEIVASLGLVTALFALTYRIVPRAPVAWRDVWVGAIMTAALFTLGRTLLGVYFTYASPGSAYGAAGSIVALLIWVNVSLKALLFGAEFTHVWATRSDPEQHRDGT
jgi:membrane protein